MTIDERLRDRIAAAEREIEDTVAQLTEGAAALALRMTALLDRLRNRPEATHPNPLGEVQSYGTEVDRLCALLKAKRDEHAVLIRIASAAARIEP